MQIKAAMAAKFVPAYFPVTTVTWHLCTIIITDIELMASYVNTVID
jgi:hypothetical protein